MFTSDFYYITFVNYNHQYLNLLKSTVESVKQFSKYQLIIYFVDCPDYISNEFKHEKIIIRHIDNIKLPSIYYYKPYVIIDAIKNGVQIGYYIESDDVLTPNADGLYKIAQNLTNLPISPIHPDFPQIPYSDFEICNVIGPSQHYVHGHVLFKNTNIQFLEEWMHYCLKYNSFRNADETVLNMIYWKYGCQNHYLPIIDPWFEEFYTNESSRKSSCSFHGCKDPSVQLKLFEDMKIFYKS